MKKIVFVCLILMLGCNGGAYTSNVQDELLMTVYRLGYTEAILDAKNGKLNLEQREKRAEEFKREHLE